MDEIELFSFKGGEVRATVKDGVPWMVAVDVATALGYSNSRDAVSKHVDAEDRATVAIRDTSKFTQKVDATNVGTDTIRTPGGNRTVNVLCKRGVFHVLMISRKPVAAEYKDRLFDLLEQYETQGVDSRCPDGNDWLWREVVRDSLKIGVAA